jgi:hypothetical protein
MQHLYALLYSKLAQDSCCLANVLQAHAHVACYELEGARQLVHA